jgi:hypothetical protein
LGLSDTGRGRPDIVFCGSPFETPGAGRGFSVLETYRALAAFTYLGGVGPVQASTGRGWPW